MSNSALKEVPFVSIQDTYINESAESPFHNRGREKRNMIVKEDSDYNDMYFKLNISEGKIIHSLI